MHTMVMAVMMLCPAAHAQLASADPEASQLRQEIGERHASVQAMLQSLMAGAEKDDVATLQKKLKIIKDVRNNLGEEAALRIELTEELLKLHLAFDSIGHAYAATDVGTLRARLADIKRVESALSASLDKKEYQALREKTESGRVKGMLSSIRSALQVYYGDNNGAFPPDLATLTVRAKYLTSIPSITLPGHKRPSNAVKIVSGVKNMQELAEKVDDAGGWLYVGDKSSQMWGMVVLNCRHHDAGDDSKPLMYTY